MRHWFAAFGVVLLAAAPVAAHPTIAVTIDDLPVHGPLPPGQTRLTVTRDIIAALKEAKMPAVHGFINGAAAAADPALAEVFTAWHAAGLPLSNHSWSHPNLDTTPVADYIAGIDRNAELLATFGSKRDATWFRFPFLAEGADPATRRTVRTALAERGMRVAGVTMSFGDYMWNDAYGRCAATGDTAAIATLETSFLSAAAEAAQASRAMAKARYGRDIPYILLLHVGAFDARMMPRLLAQYRRDGFDFTTLDKAARDPAYASDLDPKLPPEAPTPASGARDYAPMLAALCRDDIRRPT